MWATLLGKLVGGLPTEVVGYFKEKQQAKQALKMAKLNGKIAVATAKAERQAREQAHTHTWETMYVKMQENSWKDEVILGVFVWPLVGVFIPGVQDYVLTGFEYLANIPMWWTGLTVAISLAIYGIRHKNANRISAPGLRNKDVVVDDE
jgi:hypothetical protein